MRMGNERESSNVDDRRGSTGGRGSMPSSKTMMMVWPIIKPLLRTKFGWAIMAIGAMAWLAGYNPLSLLGTSSTSSAPINKKLDEKQAVFIKKVLASTEDIWSQVLPKYGIQYKDPMMVLYRGSTRSGCGHASAQMGPFYCPVDQKVYLDLGFFDELAKKHNSPGDFAQAYVLAHEIGHHIQNMQGLLTQVQKSKQNWKSEKKSNALQVRVELQADCYAGAWAYHAREKFNMLDEGDVEEALQAASAIGDDKLQREATGRVRPDAFTHGSSQDRVKWFRMGLQYGDLQKCNTFD